MRRHETNNGFQIMALITAQAGSRPGGRHTFSCFAKRKYAKRRRAAVRAAARFLALLASVGVGLNSLRSNNARPDPPAAALLSSARMAHTQQPTSEQPESKQPKSKERGPEQGRATARLCGVRYGYRYWFSDLAVMRRGVAQVQPDKGWRCLSEASLASPRLHRATQRARRADESGSPFLCLLSFGEAKESKSAAGTTSRQSTAPSGAT